MPNLRPYQEIAISQIREKFQTGFRKVLLKLPTGSGKTVCFSEIAKSALSKNKKVLIVVRGVTLVEQASARMTQEGIGHGVLMGDHWNYRPHLPCQIASIDTCISRKLKPECDLIIIDEADLATSKGYRTFLSQYPNTFILSVTATPDVEEGLRHVADIVVNPITVQELVDQKYLSPLRYFAPSAPDLKGVKIISREYKNDELEERMVAGKLTGRIIDHWIKKAENRPTLLFAVNIRHSKMLAERFLAAGVSAEHCDALVSDENRKEAFKRLETGNTSVLCTVGIATRGVDLPFVSCLVLARPTKSLRLHIQMLGRGTRICPGKSDCLILDHAGNTLEHGYITDEIETCLDGKKKTEKNVLQTKTCDFCFAVYRGKVCPECGEEKPERKFDLSESNKELQEVVVDPVLQLYNSLKREAKMRDRKQVWAMHKLVDKVGLDAARPHLPIWFIKKEELGPFAYSPFKPIIR